MNLTKDSDKSGLPSSGEMGSNSVKTYITPNYLWSNYYIKSLNSSHTSTEKSSNGMSTVAQMASIVNLPKSDSKEETRIEIESEANFMFHTEPAGVFTDPIIRNDFIRKVYSILCVQIVFTTICSGIMFHFLKDELNVKRLKDRNNTIEIIVVAVLVVTSMIVTCCVFCTFALSVKARRTVPYNFILLGLFTLAQTMLVGISVCQYYGEGIILAFVITGVVVVAITLLATTPWFDITNCGCLLFILLLIHAAMGLIIVSMDWFLDWNLKPLVMIFSVFGAFLFSLYLLYDTQLILGGKSREISPEEYIWGAVNLYVDIIQIFLYILQIVGKADNR